MKPQYRQPCSYRIMRPSISNHNTFNIDIQYRRRKTSISNEHSISKSSNSNVTFNIKGPTLRDTGYRGGKDPDEDPDGGPARVRHPSGILYTWFVPLYGGTYWYVPVYTCTYSPIVHTKALASLVTSRRHCFGRGSRRWLQRRAPRGDPAPNGGGGGGFWAESGEEAGSWGRGQREEG
jgi:hypothetical protein